MGSLGQVRVVDLFCGCGGLTLGFDLYGGPVGFQPVLAIDNDPAALRAFNRNIPNDRAVPIGRNADMTWFAHRSEALLYYLSHFASWRPDQSLSRSLVRLGYSEFLQRLRHIDEAFATAAKKLCTSPGYRRALSRIDPSVWSLALSKSILSRLGLTSFRSPAPDAERLPWTAEYKQFARKTVAHACIPDVVITNAVQNLWTAQAEHLAGATARVGKGQHATVAGKTAAVVEFLSHSAGQQLRDIWIAWRASRDSLRASFCLSVESELDRLYLKGRQVGLILGGPPCKGWSRIGRAVIESLREQGVHAWASQDYGDERNALLHNYVLFLDALRPDAFLFENVAHFESSLRTPGGDVNAASELERAVNLLGDRNTRYEVTSQVVRAREYGIPQDRERYIMVGAHKGRSGSALAEAFFSGLARYGTEVPLKVALRGLDSPGVFSHGELDLCRTEHRVEAYTLVDATMPAAERAFVNWIRQPAPGQVEPPHVTDAHIVRSPRADDELFYRLVAPGMRWMDYKFGQLPTTEQLRELIENVERFQRIAHSHDLPGLGELKRIKAKLDDSLVLRLLLEGSKPATPGGPDHHLLAEGYLVKGIDRHGDWLERLSPDRPCKTVVAHIGKDTYGYIHPTQPRALSMREAARVQTFPDFFQFGDVGVVDGYSMIGNAVPPLLASLFADRLAALHQEAGLFSAIVSGGQAVAEDWAGPIAPPAAAE